MVATGASLPIGSFAAPSRPDAKRHHLKTQKRPVASKRGQYPACEKEQTDTLNDERTSIPAPLQPWGPEAQKTNEIKA